MEEWMDGWIDGQIGNWLDGCLDGSGHQWMDEYFHGWINS